MGQKQSPFQQQFPYASQRMLVMARNMVASSQPLETVQKSNIRRSARSMSPRRRGAGVQ